MNTKSEENLGLDFTLAIFVNDKDFVPSRSQLIKVASILFKVGVVDEAGRDDLMTKIYSEEYDDDGNIVDIKGKHFEYPVLHLPWPKGFPEDIGEYETDPTQSLDVLPFDEALYDESTGNNARFTIAMGCAYSWMGYDYVYKQFEEIQDDPKIIELLEELSRALRKEVLFDFFLYF